MWTDGLNPAYAVGAPTSAGAVTVQEIPDPLGPAPPAAGRSGPPGRGRGPSEAQGRHGPPDSRDIVRTSMWYVYIDVGTHWDAFGGGY